jgi:replicative superfamily II helicase
VYSQATSAGKTVPAEILMLRHVLKYKKKALFLVPLVALVLEKAMGLRKFTDRVNLQVEAYYQNNGVIPPPPGPMICVTTVHKAHVIVNKLIDSGRLDEIGCIVVDELRALSFLLGLVSNHSHVMLYRIMSCVCVCVCVKI